MRADARAHSVTYIWTAHGSGREVLQKNRNGIVKNASFNRLTAVRCIYLNSM
jgi:hypothetical protein